MVKDKISLIAAAAGGFMLFVAISGILQGTPVTALRAQHSFDSTKMADLPLQKIHSDEPINDTLQQRFSFENSLARVSQIDKALNSFRVLTEKSKPVLESKILSEVANTDWDTQNLGFTNWVGSVEGTLRKQDYQIKKLEYQLAQKQYEDKAISQNILNQKQAAHNKAKKDFQAFIKSFSVAD
ncbi:hypothetical protein IQ247_11540 [Plectonema cf. radiosum LEGE 06105]|uniref:Uncharacterized protein n=2 Tax=Plectonema TaxID=1183 RepID=A0A8J7JUD6_9CYAN|nr:hypothetical protein [Plectonema cf. radiosum LEGE 06105]